MSAMVQNLPNLKILELVRLNYLIMTPDFGEIPNLERVILRGCRRLKKIQPSIGQLERLVFLSVEFCSALKIFPPIKRLKKLETLSLSDCPKLFKLLGIQHKRSGLLHLHSNISGKEVASYKKYSSNFVVTCWTCGGDTEIKNPAEDLVDVEECCLEEPCLPRNNKTVLRFFPRGLRKLNLRYCSLGDEDIDSAVWEFPNLEELNLKGNKFSRLSFSRWRLPRLKWWMSVVIADGCSSLESFGDTSNCIWLWKVSLWGPNNLGPLVCNILLHSMLQMIPRGFVGRLFRGTTFTRRLPYDWYKDFCGFVICIVTKARHPRINIIIRQEVDEDTLSAPWQGSSEAPADPEYVGCENEDGSNTFTIRPHDSKSSVEILWRPYYYLQKVVVKVDVHDHKEKLKVMKAVSSLSGIESIAFDMNEKEMTVTGDVDPFVMIGNIKKYCHADIVTIGPAKGW
ncbi:hypothetical protein Lser_V15G37575 [Lactuca serriola]